jgi:hypothetical protein
MKKGAETNADNKMQSSSQTDLWQFKKNHTPKRKKRNLP